MKNTTFLEELVHAILLGNITFAVLLLVESVQLFSQS
jgi:hypothetical protein